MIRVYLQIPSESMDSQEIPFSDSQNQSTRQSKSFIQKHVQLKIDKSRENFKDLVERIKKITFFNQFTIYLQRTNEMFDNIQILQNKDVIIVRNTDTFTITDEEFDVASMNHFAIDELREYRLTQKKKRSKKSSKALKLDFPQSYETDLENSTPSPNFQSRLKRINIAVIGDSGVGKTSIINRYIFSKYTSDYCSTIEDFYTTLVKITPKCEGQPTTYIVELVDTAGMEELSQIREAQFKDRDGYIFIYSCVN